MSRRPPHYRNGRRGFSLIEAALATSIVGIGVVALLQLLASGTSVNAASARLTVAMQLANNIHEAAAHRVYDQLGTLEGTYSPAVDARLTALNDMPGWTQVVDVAYVDPDRVTLTVPDTQPTTTRRINVSVSHGGDLVYATSWLVVDADVP